MQNENKAPERIWVTQKRLKQLLNYCPDTGVFYWKKRMSAQTPVGTPAGCLDIYGKYLRIKIDKVLYYAHRLAWLYMNGEWPEHEIDHINGDYSDNRISNLRDVPRSINNRNCGRRKDNRSGHLGVYQSARNGKWVARVSDDEGRLITLGTFNNKNDAVQSRKTAEIQYGYTERHGSMEKPE